MNFIEIPVREVQVTLKLTASDRELSDAALAFYRCNEWDRPEPELTADMIRRWVSKEDGQDMATAVVRVGPTAAVTSGKAYWRIPKRA